MISLDVKTESKASSPIGLAKESAQEPTVSFSELLKGVKTSKGEKEIQNGSFVLALDTPAEGVKDTKVVGKKDTFVSLLKNDSPSIDKDVLEFNPSITKNLSVAEVKTLIFDAKQFLKNKILLSNDFKVSEIQHLPKTLKGLQDMAKSFGIDLSKITLEEVQTTSKELTKQLSSLTEKGLSKALVKEEVIQTTPKELAKAPVIEKGLSPVFSKGEIKEEVTQVAQKEIPKQSASPIEKALSQVVAKGEIKEEVTQVAQKEIPKQSASPIEKALSQGVAKGKIKEEVTQAAQKETPKQSASPIEKALSQVVAKGEIKEEVTQAVQKEIPKQQAPLIEKADKKQLSKESAQETLKEDIRFNDKRADSIKEVKATPLFKASEKVELTTAQIVQTKQFKVEDKTSKSRVDDTLKLLLRGDKVTNNSINMTADFSIATARVIAPTAPSEASKSLEQLLRGSVEESTSKLDGLTTNKADSFEVKLHEAKNMIKYLSQDVKTAIEDYKSPFTRVKVQLNPAKMGEVDVTIVQRGKNLHVNISSNTAAINTLAIHANELKTQLNTSGIQNASLNFNNSDQQASQQQQNRQNERRADEEYNYYDQEEQNEEVLSSLEIIVQNYA